MCVYVVNFPTFMYIITDYKIIQVTFYELPESPKIELNKAFAYFILCDVKNRKFIVN